MMDQEFQEFEGRLRKAYPKRLIDPVSNNPLQDFLLTLGLVFNDLKGIYTFEKHVVTEYKKPKPLKATVQQGEEGGLLIQIHRILVSLIHEFFSLLSENKEILDSNEFKKIIGQTPSITQSNWQVIRDISENKAGALNDFAKTLERIRNNVSFHYYDSAKNLRSGFRERFYNKIKNEQNKYAYYSIEDSEEATRFYFSDAAVEQFIFIQSRGGRDKDLIYVDENYKNLVKKAVNSVNLTIMEIMKVYLRDKTA